MKRLALLALSLVACLPDAPGGPLVLSPTPEAMAPTEEAAARWGAATGIEILIGVGGVSVAFADYPLPHDASSCSATTVTRGPGGDFRRARVVITRPSESSLFCSRSAELALHEIGHVIQERADLGGDPSLGHVSGDGRLMSAYGTGAGIIDEASLSKVCSRAHCTAFQPEGQP